MADITPDQAIALAERLFAMGEFDSALARCREALSLGADPEPARRLIARIASLPGQSEPSGDIPAERGDDVRILKAQPGGRRHLVSVRAGHRSLHHDWFLPDEPRDWDLLIHYYAVPPAGPDLRADIVATGGLSKFYAARGLHDKLPSLFAAYDSVMFLDDDLSCDPQAIGRAFDAFAQWGLKLGQPSLSHQSYSTWPITLTCPSFQVRFTNFVEIMMPIFSRDALSRCLPSFTASVSGYGLDFVWPRLVQASATDIGIIDSVSFTHTRPIDTEEGPFYRYLRSLGIDPRQEMRDVLQHYRIRDTRAALFGGILAPAIGDGRGVAFSSPSLQPS